ncbi:MAG: TonB family protein [Pyrinomonadaceae bacterium]
MKWLVACSAFLIAFLFGISLVRSGYSPSLAVVDPRVPDVATVQAVTDPSVPESETVYRRLELPTPAPIPRIASAGILNLRAELRPEPVYPAAAKAVRATGTVAVQVIVSREGEVVSASAVSGHPLLRAAAEKAARQAKFRPTLLSGTPVMISGVLTYNFSKLGPF